MRAIYSNILKQGPIVPNYSCPSCCLLGVFSFTLKKKDWSKNFHSKFFQKGVPRIKSRKSTKKEKDIEWGHKKYFKRVLINVQRCLNHSSVYKKSLGKLDFSVFQMCNSRKNIEHLKTNARIKYKHPWIDQLYEQC